MHQKNIKEGQHLTGLGSDGGPVGIVQDTEMSPYTKMVYAQNRILPREWDAYISLWFWLTKTSPNPGKRNKFTVN